MKSWVRKACGKNTREGENIPQRGKEGLVLVPMRGCEGGLEELEKQKWGGYYY